MPQAPDPGPFGGGESLIAAQYTQGASAAEGRFAVRDVPVPTIAADEMLLRIDAASICGTDVKIIQHGHRKLTPGQTITLGHEFVGIIEKRGPRVPGFREGQRVGIAPNMGLPGSEMVARGMANMDPGYTAFGITQDGAHTEYLRITPLAIEQGNVMAIPDGVSSLHATLAEPLSCCVNAMRTARVERGDRVVVIGAGPMGLLNMMLAKANGAAEVIAVDLNDARLAKALALGATLAVNTTKIPLKTWIAEHTRGRGVDVVINAVPVAALQQDLLEILAPFGRLCLFAGWPKGAAAVPLDTNPIHYKNLVVTGMTGGCNRDYAAALDLIATKAVDVSQVVSDVVHVSHLQKAYDIALAGKGMKIVITAHTSEECIRS